MCMEIGISIPPHTSSPEQLFDWARLVDSGPFSTLSALDRVAYQNFEPLVTLAFAAAITTRVRLMTEVLISPIRNTTILAKESATLDVLSRGRLTLGLGLGGREEDYKAAGIPYEHRGRRFNEQLSQMKSIWTGQAPSSDVGPIQPQPIQRNGPELLLGGFTPRAIQRAARHGDGFITERNRVEEVNRLFRGMEDAWQEAGREGKPRLVAQVDTALDPYGTGQGQKNIADYYAAIPSFTEYKSKTLRTGERQLSEVIQALEQIGTDEVVFFTWGTELEQIARIASLVG
jgi:alkanesulfonate monooxygenase SsuD/methylene tetrahydromethanopterin reductase-like flavin-dependent oxidoreductase (luciferase family)